MGVLSKISTVFGRVGLQKTCLKQLRLNQQELFPQNRTCLVPARTIVTAGPSSTNYSSQVMPLMESWSMDTFVKDKLVYYTNHSPTPISIEQFMIMGKDPIQEKDSFLFLLNEMANRLAHTIIDLHRMPDELKEMDDCQFIIKQYTLSFAELLEFHDRAPGFPVMEEFGKFLDIFQARLEDTVPRMANACMEMTSKRGMGLDDATCPLSMSIKHYLDRLYTSMISLQMLGSQHLAMYGHERSLPNQIGIINPQTKLTSVLVDCYDDAAFDCENTYMVAPKLNIKNYNATDPEHDVDTPVTGVHIPAHLATIFHEVLKNSMRATVEHHWDNKDNLPPITAIVCQSNDDFTIKISDQGGGVARHNVEKMFFYLYTTKGCNTKDCGKALGYGLPVAQLYARYFHGDLRIASYESYGTDVYIYIRALASTAVERLPMYDPFATDDKYDSDMGKDWTSKFGSDILKDVKTSQNVS